MINLRNSLKACSGRLTSCQLVQVRINPHTKKSTRRARPIACKPSCTFTMIFHISPPLNDSGDSVSNNHISASLEFQVLMALVRLSMIPSIH